jgi:hypothetical protein
MSVRHHSVILPVLTFIIFGTINAITEKVLYEQESQGSPDLGIHKFVKPFFFSTMLLFGVSFSLPVYFILSKCNIGSYSRSSIFPRPRPIVFVLPGIFGYFQGMMSSITAALIGVSVDYMMRSATLLGVSFIAKFYFKRRFKTHEWFGMFIVAFSLVLVGMSSVVSAGTSITIHVSRHLAIVILLFKAMSQVCYSIKLSLEQYYTQQLNVHPMYVTGFESFWGFAIGAFVFWPIVHRGPGIEGQGMHENLWDTITQLKNNWRLGVTMVCSICFECVYSVSSVALTEATSAVARTLVESFRTFIIWVLQLGLFYGLSKTKWEKYRTIGEQWSTGSWLQLFAYAVLICGFLMYRGSLFQIESEKSSAERFRMNDGCR